MKGFRYEDLPQKVGAWQAILCVTSPVFISAVPSGTVPILLAGSLASPMATPYELCLTVSGHNPSASYQQPGMTAGVSFVIEEVPVTSVPRPSKKQTR